MEDDRLIEIEEDEEEDFIDDEEEEEDDYEEGEDEDYEDEDEEDYEEEGIEELIPVELTSPSVSTSIANGSTLQGAVVINDGMPDNLESCDGKPGKQENGGDDGGKEALDRGQIDGLFCPICFEAWTSGGGHQISCLPCGHIYGLSCIKKWLQRSASSKKCPQCKGLCTLKDVRVLYAARLCVADEELHKRVRDLEDECAYYKQKVQDCQEIKLGEDFTRIQALISSSSSIARFDNVPPIVEAAPEAPVFAASSGEEEEGDDEEGEEEEEAAGQGIPPHPAAQPAAQFGPGPPDGIHPWVYEQISNLQLVQRHQGEVIRKHTELLQNIWGWAQGNPELLQNIRGWYQDNPLHPLPPPQ